MLAGSVPHAKQVLNRRCAALRCAVLFCSVLCCAVLCCAVLCCAVLCCAVLCCAVLCCAVQGVLRGHRTFMCVAGEGKAGALWPPEGIQPGHGQADWQL